jgi:hypothetical protein
MRRSSSWHADCAGEPEARPQTFEEFMEHTLNIEVCLAEIQQRFPHETNDELLGRLAKKIIVIAKAIYSDRFPGDWTTDREKVKHIIKVLDEVCDRELESYSKH